MSEESNANHHPKDPLHGIKLEAILTDLVEKYGWEGLADRIPVNCFKSNPSIKSSLKFLRKTPWARQKVESLYLRMQGHSASKRATKTARALEAEVMRTQAPSEKKPRAKLSRGTDGTSIADSRSKSNPGKVNPWLNAKPNKG